jgi:hypothetical protein
MRGLDVEVARRADRTAADVHDERDLVLVLEREVEPAVEAEGVHVGEAMNLRLALSRVAEPLPVPLGDRLDADDPPSRGSAGRSSFGPTERG